MKNNFNKFTITVILILILTGVQSFSQVPDDINGRLWRLAKVWGFAKYYHPNNCITEWNDLALEAIDSILVSGSNQSFNAALEGLLTKSGDVTSVTEPLNHFADINLNAQFDWIDDSEFSIEVQSILDSIQKNFRPKENCLVKYNDYMDGNYTGYLSFSNDNLFNVPSFSYTKESHRLLALFYYWNIINYYHAQRDLMDQDWDSTLYQFIPLIREVTTDTAFHIRFLNLVTQINDTHGFTNSPILVNFLGSKMPLLKLEYIDDQTIVSKIGPEETVIELGDRVTKINGIDIDTYRDSISNYIPASNESALNRDLNTTILQGPIATTINFEMERLNEEIYTTSLNRNFSFQTYFNWIENESKPVWEITTCGYGYVNMGKLTISQVPLMYQALIDAPAIIFDVRNYPKGTINALIPYLFPEPITYALFTIPDLTDPGWYDWVDNKVQTGSFANAYPYNGEVIILVNAATQSHAEYTVMGLQQHPNAYTIGSQTAGADGNVSNIALPGNLKTTWTSLGVFYPDSANAQRVGVKIDSIVTPTVQAILSGVDEVLEAAYDCLNSTTIESKVKHKFSLYPNPANDLIYLSVDFRLSTTIEIEAFNVLGQKVFQKKILPEDANHFAINVGRWNDGTFIITLSDETGILGSEKIRVQH